MEAGGRDGPGVTYQGAPLPALFPGSTRRTDCKANPPDEVCPSSDSAVMKRLLTRLARTSSGELLFRAREKACVAVEALRFASGGERWRREILRSRLIPRSTELEGAREALAGHEWSRAGAALRSHFTDRPTRFLIDPAGRQAVSTAARARFPGCAADAAGRANRLLDGHTDLLGYRGLSFRRGSDIDWQFDPVLGRRAPVRFWTRVPYLDPRVGDHKVIWELNRHQHWMTLGRAAWLTGDGRYAAAVAGELESWMRANPPLAGINWSSMLELALRSISWIWALHFCTAFDDEDEPAWLVDLLVGLDRQLDHVARHLSVYFSPNTHLLGEALALYVSGRVLPEFTSAARWEQIGREILIREARAQVNGDGGHAELSTHYHRYALDFYLLALAVARRTGDRAADRFEEVASRLATFCRALAGNDGRLPTIGDDDGGLLFPICGRSASDASDSLALAAALLGRPELAVGDPPEEVFWMCGGEVPVVRPGSPRAPASQFFPDSGYAVVRSPAGHAILDAGRHGFLNGGHAHADALSLVLSVGNRPLLIDPGTATYTTDQDLRDRFRSTAMHNSVVVDGRSQSVPAGPFHWKSRANAQADVWRPGPELDYVEALHDGYLPLVHRRAVVRTHGGQGEPDDLWLVADHIVGTGHHRVDTYWHIDPAWTLRGASAAGVRLEHREGLWAAIASTAGQRREFHGDAEGLGWCAPVYGELVPSLTLGFTESADAPVSLITAIAAAASSVRLTLEPAPVVADRKDGWLRTAVMVRVGDAGILALFAAPGVGPLRRRSLQRVALGNGELGTDARLALLRFSRSGEPYSLSLLDGREAAWTGRNAFGIAPLAEAGDLHLDATALRQLRSDAVACRVG